MTKTQFKALSPGQKIKYILKRYGWEAVFAVYLVSLLGSWIYLDYVAEQPVLNVEMIDGNQNVSSGEAFAEFLSQEGYSSDFSQVKVSRAIQIGNEPGDLQIPPEPLLICKINTCKTDLYFWDDQYMEASLAAMDLIDLREVLPMDVLVACQDRLIYTAPILDGGFPCGIHLKDCPWVEEFGFYQDCAVGISRNVQNPELVTAFIEYII